VTLRIVSAPAEEWRLWSANPGDPSYGANFYTSSEPYGRRRVTITHMELAADSERRERERGYVTLPELPDEVIKMWAESDAQMIVGLVLNHLAGKE